jgi:hypothetical protein
VINNPQNVADKTPNLDFLRLMFLPWHVMGSYSAGSPLSRLVHPLSVPTLGDKRFFSQVKKPRGVLT